MPNYEIVKDYLAEIKVISSDISDKDLKNTLSGLPNEEDLVNQTDNIFHLLLKAPIGISIDEKLNRRLIILAISIFDELEFYKDKSKSGVYFEFRYKAFRKFLKNNYDAEAACILDNLRNIKRIIEHENNLWHDKINNQIKIYRRLINEKIEIYEKRNDYNQAQFLNSIYYVHPEYEFESRLQEKESKYIRLPFFEIMIEIVIPIVLLSALLGINALSRNNDDDNIFAYFTKGNFTFNDLILVFFVIYLTFWIFKLLEYSKLNLRLTVFFKVLIIISLIGSIILSAHYQYNVKISKYFPENFNNQDGKTRILVMKFNPLEEHSIFDQSYSEINVSQLFYKKMLTLNQNEQGLQNSSMEIDYYPYDYIIQDTSDYNRIFCQKKYDAIISNDVLERNSEINLFTTLYITDDSLKKLYYDLNNYRLNSKLLFSRPFDNKKNICTTTVKDFLTYIDWPIDYYENLCFHTNTTDQFNIKIEAISLSQLKLSSDLPSGLSFTNTLENSTTISLNYFRALCTFNECKPGENDSLTEVNLKSCLNLINETLLKSADTLMISSESFKLKQLRMQLLNMKLFIINQMISCNTDYNKQFSLWLQKLNCFNDFISLVCDMNNISKCNQQCLIAYNIFLNYKYLYQISQERKQDKDFFEKVKKNLYRSFERRMEEQNELLTPFKNRFFNEEINGKKQHEIMDNDVEFMINYFKNI